MVRKTTVDRKKPIKTPRGATLGDPIIINGGPGIRYKAGKKQDDMTPEQVVECITHRKVLKIVYAAQEPEYAL